VRPVHTLALAVLGVLATLGACGKGGGTTGTTGLTVICDPGENIFCRCRGGDPGTKTCRADGHSFDECITDTGPCPVITVGASSAGSGGGTTGTGGATGTGGSMGTGGATTGTGGSTTGTGGAAAGTGGATTTTGTGGATTTSSSTGAGGADGGTPVAGDYCPGIAVAITPTNDVVLSGDTSVATGSYKGTGTCSTSASTKDLVYAVTPTQNGTLTVTMSPTYDGQLYARSGSCTTGAQIACSEVGGVGVSESISFAVVSSTKYSVFVDGKNGSAGTYSITFHLGP
jgi:hypothetical protein